MARHVTILDSGASKNKHKKHAQKCPTTKKRNNHIVSFFKKARLSTKTVYASRNKDKRS